MPTRLIRALLLRSLVLAGLYAASLAAFPVLMPDDDDGLGSGLTYLLLIVMIATIWGILDGIQLGLWRSAVVWSGTGAVTALATQAVQDAIYGGWGLIWSDLRDTGVFMTELVAVPAILAACLSALVDKLSNTAQVDPGRDA